VLNQVKKTGGGFCGLSKACGFQVLGEELSEAAVEKEKWMWF
jgi:hypothetical protein